MKNTLLKNDINRMIKFYDKQIDGLTSNNYNENEKIRSWYTGKKEAYQEVLEMVEKYEKII